MRYEKIADNSKTEIVNPDVFEDHRGTIFSFPINDNLTEYNLMITKKGDARGYHYHPEFNEYMMVVSGRCEYTEFVKFGEDVTITLEVGDSIRIPLGTSHRFVALEDYSFVSMLTKHWDACEHPIIKVDSDGKV
jgi:quercetin dioxygenase-like cupin family protein